MATINLTSTSISGLLYADFLQIKDALQLAGSDINVGNITSTGLTVDTDTLVVDDTNNRVGIGTASPLYDLHIVNTGNVRQTLECGTSSLSQIAYVENGGQTWSTGLRGSTNNYVISAGSSLSADEAIVIDSSGNVGIGITSPAARTHIYRDLASGSTSTPVCFIEQDNSGDDQNALSIQNDGTGKGVQISQNANSVALFIDSNASTNKSLDIYSDVAFTGTRFCQIKLDNASSTGNVLELTNDGTGNGLFIDQNGDGKGIEIDSEATTSTNYGLSIITGQGADVALLQSTSTDYYLKRTGASATASNHFYRNISSEGTAAPLMFIEQDNSSDDQDVLKVQNDGTGNSLVIQSNNTGYDIEFEKDSKNAYVNFDSVAESIDFVIA